MREPGPCARPEEGSAVTIGVFDGVHLGHQHVIAEARRLAAERRAAQRGRHLRPPPGRRRAPRVGARCCSPTSSSGSSCWPSTGVDLTYVVAFDEARSKESAEDFVESVLVGCLRGPGRRRGGRLPLRPPAPGRRRPAPRRWAGRTASRSTASSCSPPRRPGPRADVVDRHPRRPWPPATWTTPTACWAGPTRCGAWSPTATSGAGSSASRRPTSPCRPTSACPADGIYAGWYVRPDGAAHPVRHLPRPAADLLRRRRRLAARGPPARLRRRPLRRAGPGALRGPAARRAALRLRRRPGRARWRRDVDEARAVAGVVAVATLSPTLWPATPGAAHRPGPASPATCSTSSGATGCRCRWPAGGCRSSSCTASPPRASSTPRRLSRLVASGFKVVAIDTAGHGGTEGLRGGRRRPASTTPGCSAGWSTTSGIERAVFAGHSMGGRLVTELVARQPRRAIAVVLIDAIVGDTWDGHGAAVAPGARRSWA